MGNKSTFAVDPSGLEESLWGRVRHAAKRADQFVGQVGVYVFTGDWIDPDLASGAKLQGSFLSEARESLSDGRSSDSLQGAGTEWLDQLADFGVSSLNSFTGTVNNVYVAAADSLHIRAQRENPLYLDRDKHLGGRWIDMFDPIYGHVQEFEQGRAVGAHTFHAQLTVLEVAAIVETVIAFPQMLAGAAAWGKGALAGFGSLAGGSGGAATLSSGWAIAGQFLGVAPIPLAGVGLTQLIDWEPTADFHFNYMAEMRPSRAAQELYREGWERVYGAKRPYADPNKRPSYREGLVEEVWERNKKGGQVRDPHTDEILEWDPSKPRNDQWHMGHKPHKEYAKLHKDYMDGKISKQEFLDEYNNPDNYWPEAPTENLSHRHEAR